jgi:uncharacterized protein YjbI with pentapeptide repeats
VTETCRYFDSDEWDERLKRHVGRIWDVQDLVGAYKDEDIDVSEITEEDTEHIFELDMGDVVSIWREAEQALDNISEECPHDVEKDGLCIFHLPVGKKDDEETKAKLLEKIGQGGKGSKYFLGGKFGELDLAYEILESEGDTHLINLRFAEIGELNMRATTVRQPWDISRSMIRESHLLGTRFETDSYFHSAEFVERSEFRGAEFRRSSYFLNAEFGRESDFLDAEFGGFCIFRGAEFKGDTDFRSAEFKEGSHFADVEFKGDTYFRNAGFGEGSQFNNAEFRGGSEFHRAEFSGDSYFRHAEFGGDSEFREAEFEERANFYGARFGGEAGFRETEFGGDSDFGSAEFGAEANFRFVEFGAEANFDGAEFRGVSYFSRPEFGGEANFRFVEFGGEANFGGAEFGGDSEFKETEFGEKANFNGAKFGGEANFYTAEFGGMSQFSDTVFGGDSDFRSVEFGEKANFRRAEFGGETEFRNTEFGGRESDFRDAEFIDRSDFRDAEFVDRSLFRDAEFGGNSDFSRVGFGGRTDFRDVEFGGEAEFREAEFGGRSDFNDAEFGGWSDFYRAEFNKSISFDNSTLNDVNFGETEASVIHLEDTIIHEAEIQQPEDRSTFHDFTGATLGDVTIQKENCDHNLFDYFRFYRTDFDGFDFTDYKDELGSKPEIHEFGHNSDYEQEETPAGLEATYLKAKDGAKKVGDHELASKFFVKEMQYRRDRYKHEIENDRVGWKRRIKLEFKRGINWLYEVTSGYGEKPRRVIETAVLVVFFFAFLYPLDGIRRVQDGSAQVLTYGSANSFAERLDLLLESFYFSAVTFTTLGYGDLQPVGYSHALSVAESATGALLIALLIFVFGRSVKW